MVASMAKQQDLFGAPPRCFENDAYGFLIAYVKRVQGPFCSEDVTLAAIAKGIAPADLRSWGSVFTQAARDGYIRRSKKAFRRVMGNNTLTLGWERV